MKNKLKKILFGGVLTGILINGCFSGNKVNYNDTEMLLETDQNDFVIMNKIID